MGHPDHIWQSDIPKLAFAHPFLLHQVLAMAAFHLAYLAPGPGPLRRQHLAQASHHQNSAIQGIRGALADLTPDNCHALFPASSLLSVGALAERAEPFLHDSDAGGGTDPPTIEHLLDVFLLAKGIGSVMGSSASLLFKGPLRGLLASTATEGPHPALERLMVQLHNFSDRLGALPPETKHTETIRAAVVAFVQATQGALSMTDHPEQHLIGAWPMMVTDEFIALLRRRNQMALALLAYFCVIMWHASKLGCWFVDGWGLRVLREIDGVMSPPWNEESAWALAWIASLATTTAR